MKLAALLVAAAALAHGQVAGRANAHYRTAEGRAGLVAGMASDYWRDQQKPPNLTRLSSSSGA